MRIRFAVEKLGLSLRSGEGSLANPSESMIQFFGGGSSVNGVNVNQQTALSVAAVYRAVRFISENMASLPGQVVKKIPGENRRERMPLHRVTRIMERPGFYNGFSFMETMQSYVSLRGNGVAIIRRDIAKNEPTGFEIIEPYRVDPILDNGKVYYQIRDKQGKPHIYYDFQVFHIPCVPLHPKLPGVWGINPLEYHRTTLGFQIAVNEYGPRVFNGVNSAGYLSTDMELDDDQVMRISEQWQKRHGGLDNVGSTPVLEQGMKFIPLTMKPEDLQFIDTRKLNVVDIANIFAVPPYVVGDYSKSTHSNIEQQSIDIVRYTFRPHAIRWETEIKRKLISTKEVNTHNYRFDLEDLTRGDSQARADLIEANMKWGIKTRDEIRESEDYNPLPDGEGSKTLVPMNYTTIDKLPDPNAGQNTNPNE